MVARGRLKLYQMWLSDLRKTGRHAGWAPPDQASEYRRGAVSRLKSTPYLLLARVIIGTSPDDSLQSFFARSTGRFLPHLFVFLRPHTRTAHKRSLVFSSNGSHPHGGHTRNPNTSAHQHTPTSESQESRNHRSNGCAGFRPRPKHAPTPPNVRRKLVGPVESRAHCESSGKGISTEVEVKEGPWGVAESSVSRVLHFASLVHFTKLV